MEKNTGFILVSACLAGVNCRYDGTNRTDEKVMELAKQGKIIPLCPEVEGGRPVPRESVEITGGTAEDVLAGNAFVKDKEGKDHTKEVIAGVEYVMAAVKKLNIKQAVLKSKSPTCGSGKVYDGTFSGTLIDGHGVLAEALIAADVEVYTENNIEKLLEKL